MNYNVSIMTLNVFFSLFCNKILKVFMNSKYCIYSHRRKEIEHKMFNIQILTA